MLVAHKKTYMQKGLSCKYQIYFKRFKKLRSSNNLKCACY